MKLEEKISEIINDRKFIDEMNEMMLNWSVDLLVKETPLFNLRPTTFTWGESKLGEAPWSDGEKRYIQYVNRWHKKDNFKRYRVYNDRASSFATPQISKISVLNDPLDTIWLHKNISGYSFIFLRALMNHKICASYMAPAEVEELYMISNYARVTQQYIEFELNDVIRENAKENYFMGHVLYPSQRNFGIILKNIKKSLGVKTMNKGNDETDSLALYYAIEMIISCFIKEYSMRKENEFRTISFKGFLAKPIPVKVTKNKLSFDILEEKNKYYQTVEDIKSVA